MYKEAGYLCQKCWKSYSFNIDDVREEYICPKCGDKLFYVSTNEKDSSNGKCINSYREPERVSQNPGNPSTSQYQHLIPPTITCPYCKSTDCKKISGLSKAGSVALWGIFALGKTTKQWHCRSCGSDF